MRFVSTAWPCHHAAVGTHRGQSVARLALIVTNGPTEPRARKGASDQAGVGRGRRLAAESFM
jgi:hypothetical protein